VIGATNGDSQERTQTPEHGGGEDAITSQHSALDEDDSSQQQRYCGFGERIRDNVE
jgi:hypothetical protein